jgi:hypothetical protein
MSSLYLVAVKLTKRQLRALDTEVRKRRKATFDVTASRSSVLRDALEKLVTCAQVK